MTGWAMPLSLDAAAGGSDLLLERRTGDAEIDTAAPAISWSCERPSYDPRRRSAGRCVDRDRLARAEREGRRERADAREGPLDGDVARLRGRFGRASPGDEADAPRRRRRRRQLRAPGPVGDLLREGARRDLAPACAVGLRAAAAPGRRRLERDLAARRQARAPLRRSNRDRSRRRRSADRRA